MRLDLPKENTMYRSAQVVSSRYEWLTSVIVYGQWIEVLNRETWNLYTR